MRTTRLICDIFFCLSVFRRDTLQTHKSECVFWCAKGLPMCFLPLLQTLGLRWRTTVWWDWYLLPLTRAATRYWFPVSVKGSNKGSSQWDHTSQLWTRIQLCLIGSVPCCCPLTKTGKPIASSLLVAWLHSTVLQQAFCKLPKLKWLFSRKLNMPGYQHINHWLKICWHPASLGFPISW
jgi:hypothetical protein